MARPRNLETFVLEFISRHGDGPEHDEAMRYLDAIDARELEFELSQPPPPPPAQPAAQPVDVDANQ